MNERWARYALEAVKIMDSKPAEPGPTPEDLQRWRDLMGGTSGVMFDLGVPIDICPDCYAQRDATIPLLQMTAGSPAYFRLPTTGERLKDAPRNLRVCLRCGWGSEGER